MLGGSRARGDAAPDSDVDLGLYYRPPLDVAALAALALEVAGPEARVTMPGAWGPWVDGGGWLRLGNRAVDWIYRDLSRVRQSWENACQGRYQFHAQVGHPLGVPDFAYIGELALGVTFADPTGELRDLQHRASEYPLPLAEGLVAGLFEAQFLVDNAAKSASRGDAAHLAGCLFRAVLLCAHALHGRSGRWLVNEKGAIAAAGRLAIAPPDFAARSQQVFAHLGPAPHELETARRSAELLVSDTAAACAEAAPLTLSPWLPR